VLKHIIVGFGRSYRDEYCGFSAKIFNFPDISAVGLLHHWIRLEREYAVLERAVVIGVETYLDKFI